MALCVRCDVCDVRDVCDLRDVCDVTDHTWWAVVWTSAQNPCTTQKAIFVIYATYLYNIPNIKPVYKQTINRPQKQICIQTDHQHTRNADLASFTKSLMLKCCWPTAYIIISFFRKYTVTLHSISTMMADSKHKVKHACGDRSQAIKMI